MVQMLDSVDIETRAVPRRRLTLLWALSVGALALHNAEEWLFGLTGWIAGHPWMPGRALHGDQAQFALALVMVTAAVFAIAVIAVATRAAWSEGALVAVAYALMVNAGSHLVVSVASWSLMPGVVSGALVLFPLGLFMLRTLPPLRWTTLSLVVTAAAAVTMVMGSLLLAAALTAVFGAVR